MKKIMIDPFRFYEQNEEKLKSDEEEEQQQRKQEQDERRYREWQKKMQPSLT